LAALTRWWCGGEQAVIDHYETPKNVGSFDKKGLDIGTGANPLCAAPIFAGPEISGPSDCSIEAGVGARPLPVAQFVPGASGPEPCTLNHKP